MNLPKYDDALRLILSDVTALPAERVALNDAAGRVLREAVTADRDQPPFHRAAMDGFALRSADLRAGASFDIVADIPAGGAAGHGADLSRGVARIATGAAVPAAYDAVVQVELAHVDGERVRFDLDSCKPWRNVHTRGSDAHANDPLLQAGQGLDGPQLGIAAAVGRAVLSVTRRPRVTLLTTGDEVLPPESVTLEPQQIRNSNGPMLAAMLPGWGAVLLRHEHVPDNAAATREAAMRALDGSDLVLTTGGVSVGQRDYLPDTWNRLSARTVLHGVAIQPGRPLLSVARAPHHGALVIGLPGNPVSVLMTAILFVQPVLRAMLGLDPALPWRPRKLAHAVKSNPKRQLFRAARLNDSEHVEVTDWHGSGDLSHTATMRGVVRLPVQSEPVEAGATLMYLSHGSA